jgi:alpha-L-fucosidase 2
VALRARLHDPDGAYEMLRRFLEPMAEDASDEPSTTAAAGVYRNLFCAHPPFQIDGNFGFTAGVAEMLLQSHAGTDEVTEIRLLPALPAAWAEGSFTGLRARGAVTVDATWSDGAPQQVTLVSDTDRTVVLRFGTRRVQVTTVAHVPHRLDAAALA